MSSAIRIGQGFDVHAFGPGDHVMLGGVRVPHTRGVLAHSDGDVALHALCDALLGALALSDIGRHFPDKDPRWKGADSLDLLRHCAGLVGGRGFALGNADITVICEMPKLAPHVETMRTRIAQAAGMRDRRDQRQGDHQREARVCRPRRRHRGDGGGAACAFVQSMN